MDDLTGSLTKMGEAGKKGGKKAEDALKGTTSEADKLKKGVDETSKKFTGLGSIMKGAFVGIAGSAIIRGIRTLTTGAYDLADGFANVEYAAAKVNTLAKQELPEVLQDMRNIALDYGIQDATLVGEAMYQALSAGRDYQSLMDGFMDENLQISKAGFVDPLGAVDLTTTIMNTYQLEEMNGIGDALLATQDRGKTTVNEVSQYYAKQFGAFRSIGVGYKDALALLAETTRMGQRTADASTGIGAMMSEFSKSDSSVNEYFKELNGTTIPEFLKNGGSIVEVIGTVKSTLDVLNMSSFDMFGSIEAARTFETMTSDMDGLIKTQERVIDSTGKLEESFDTMSQTTKTALEEAKAAWADFKVDMGEALALPVTATLRIATDIVNAIFKGDFSFKNSNPQSDYSKLDARSYDSGDYYVDSRKLNKNVHTTAEEATAEQLEAYIADAYSQRAELTDNKHLSNNKKIIEILEAEKDTRQKEIKQKETSFFNTSNPMREKTLEQVLTEVTNTTNNENTQTTSVTNNNYITVTTQGESEIASKVANEIERSTISYLPKKPMSPSLGGLYDRWVPG